VQAHDSQQDLYYADLFPKKLCPTTLFNNPTRANWQKATDISAETDHLVFKQWNYRVQAFIYLLLERALINYRDLPPLQFVFLSQWSIDCSIRDTYTHLFAEDSS